MKNIYVGNLSYSVNENELRSFFAPYGEVSSVTIVKDKLTGQARGFGFVEMSNDQDADQAISNLDGKDLKGRSVKVNEARPREQRSHSGGMRRG